MTDFSTISNDALTSVTGGSLACSIAGQRAAQEAARHYPAADARTVSRAYGSAVQATCERLERAGVSPSLFGR